MSEITESHIQKMNRKQLIQFIQQMREEREYISNLIAIAHERLKNKVDDL